MSGQSLPARRSRRQVLAEPSEARPADECPYRRPFPDDFDDCPAYAARRFVPFDTMHRPLQPVWTCNFLIPKRSGASQHGYYAACSLGDAAARQRWVEEVRKERLDSVVRLQRATTAIAQPYLTEIYAAKRRQLEPGENQLKASAELGALLARLETEIVKYIDTNRADFNAASLPVEACKELMTLAMRDAAESRNMGGEGFRAPPELLDKFPAEVRPLLFPATPPE